MKLKMLLLSQREASTTSSFWRVVPATLSISTISFWKVPTQISNLSPPFTDTSLVVKRLRHPAGGSWLRTRSSVTESFLIGSSMSEFLCSRYQKSKFCHIWFSLGALFSRSYIFYSNHAFSLVNWSRLLLKTLISVWELWMSPPFNMIQDLFIWTSFLSTFFLCCVVIAKSILCTLISV